MRSSTVLVALATSLLASANPIPRQFCPEALRFGIFQISPSTLKAGDNFTITANYDCAVNSFHHVPTQINYEIHVPVDLNNGFEQPILLAQRDAPGITDTFTGTIPFAPFVANASYELTMWMTYPTKGTDGESSYLVIGGIEGNMVLET